MYNRQDNNAKPHAQNESGRGKLIQSISRSRFLTQCEMLVLLSANHGVVSISWLEINATPAKEKGSRWNKSRSEKRIPPIVCTKNTLSQKS